MPLAQVYARAASAVVRSTLEGLNGTVFAYGVTSSGKTFTMMVRGLLCSGLQSAGDLPFAAATWALVKEEDYAHHHFMQSATWRQTSTMMVRGLTVWSRVSLSACLLPRRGVCARAWHMRAVQLLLILIHKQSPSRARLLCPA